MVKLPWDQIDTVLLDMDGTLLDLHFDWIFWSEYLPEAYARHHNLPLDNAQRFVKRVIEQQSGTLNWYCLDYWSRRLNLSVADLKHDLKHLIREHPDVLEFLGQLRQANKQVIMVTNAHRDSLALKLERTAIGEYFDHIISAHDFRIPKEDIRIWDRIQDVAPYDPDRTLLVDDNIVALNTAHRYGIRHLLAAIHVSPHMDKVDPQGYDHFETYAEIMPIQTSAQTGRL